MAKAFYRAVSKVGVRYPFQFKEQLKELRSEKLEVGLDFVGKDWKIVSRDYATMKAAEEHGKKWGFDFEVEKREL